MNRRTFIHAAAAVLLAGPLAFHAQPLQRAAQPNILFLFADDQRADTIAAHGNQHIRTPNLDDLARRGFSFRANYVFGGNNAAVCVPSRAMLMSGKTWFRIDAPTLNGTRLMPEILGEHGFVTFGTGKWHNGQASWLRAFQRGKNVMFGGMSDHTRVPVRDRGPDGLLTAERTGEKFSSQLFADSAIEFLQNHDGAKPFFAYVAFTAPHDPRQPPEAYREMYYRNLPPSPSNFLPQLPFDNGMMKDLRDENLAAWPRTEAVIRDQLAEYYGLITHMDEQIGRILAALQASGQAGNTIVMFAADNGLALGSHGLLGKQSVFEHSMRTPFIVVGPGIPAGQSTGAFTYLLDIFPTLFDTLGIEPPGDLEGESLRPLWEGRKTRVRDSVFLPFLGIQRAVRDDRWKLIAYPQIGHLQLFDLQTDPNETTDVLAGPDAAAQVPRLQALMKQWQSRVGDALELPVSDRAPARIDLTGQSRKPDQFQPDWIVKKVLRPVQVIQPHPHGSRLGQPPSGRGNLSERRGPACGLLSSAFAFAGSRRRRGLSWSSAQPCAKLLLPMARFGRWVVAGGVLAASVVLLSAQQGPVDAPSGGPQASRGIDYGRDIEPVFKRYLLRVPRHRQGPGASAAAVTRFGPRGRGVGPDHYAREEWR